MTPEEYNLLDIAKRGDLLWGAEGKGKFIEEMGVYVKFKAALYIMDDLVVSVSYDLDTNKITGIKAWGNPVDKQKIMENVMLN